MSFLSLGGADQVMILVKPNQLEAACVIVTLCAFSILLRHSSMRLTIVFDIVDKFTFSTEQLVSGELRFCKSQESAHLAQHTSTLGSMMKME